MAIVCGIDLAGRDESAVVRAAAAMARRAGEELHLAHAVDLGAATAYGYGGQALLQAAGERLEALAARWRDAGKVAVRTRVLEGPADERLAAYAASVGARALFVGAVARAGAVRWLVGSTAERVAQAATVPVLVIRDPAPWEAWAADERPLRVALALDLSQTADAAARFTRALMRLGACEVVAVHSYGPYEERWHYGLSGTVAPTEIEKLVVRDLEERLKALGMGAAVPLVVRAAVERTGDHVAELAAEQRADLVVVGTHQRSGAQQLWAGSVSHRVLQRSSASVACVSAMAAPAREFPPAPRVRTVLVPSDLSAHTARALAYAYSVVEDGGTVYLVHVVDAERAGQLPAEPLRAALEERLRALLPLDYEVRRCSTKVEVETGARVAVALAQTAERVGADLVCLSSRARPGLRTALGGSVARDLLGLVQRPVLVLPAGDV